MFDPIPKIASPRDLYALLGSTESVRVNAGDIKRFVAPYQFDTTDHVPCGLQDCRRIHGKGIVIETMAGVLVNVGHCCGRTKFGVEFSRSANAFHRHQEEQHRQQFLRALLAQSTAIRQRCQELCDGTLGANKQSEMIRDFRSAYPRQLIERLERLSATGVTAVSDIRRRTEEEVAVARNANPGARNEQLLYEHVLKGHLRGLGMIRGTSARLQINTDVLEPLSALEQGGTNLRGRRLNDIYRRCSRIEQALSEVAVKLRAGEDFFTPENFALLPLAVEGDVVRRQVVAVRWNFERQCSAPTNESASEGLPHGWVKRR